MEVTRKFLGVHPHDRNPEPEGLVIDEQDYDIERSRKLLGYHAYERAIESEGLLNLSVLIAACLLALMHIYSVAVRKFARNIVFEPYASPIRTTTEFYRNRTGDGAWYVRYSTQDDEKCRSNFERLFNAVALVMWTLAVFLRGSFGIRVFLIGYSMYTGAIGAGLKEHLQGYFTEVQEHRPNNGMEGIRFRLVYQARIGDSTFHCISEIVIDLAAMGVWLSALARNHVIGCLDRRWWGVGLFSLPDGALRALLAMYGAVCCLLYIGAVLRAWLGPNPLRKGSEEKVVEGRTTDARAAEEQRSTGERAVNDGQQPINGPHALGTGPWVSILLHILMSTAFRVFIFMSALALTGDGQASPSVCAAASMTNSWLILYVLFCAGMYYWGTGMYEWYVKEYGPAMNS